MTLKNYLLTMTATTGLAWVAFIVVVYQINPFEGGEFGLLVFYVSLGLSLMGTLALLGFFIRSWLLKDKRFAQFVTTSFRQGIWLALVVVFSFLLQSQRLFRWWNIRLFILFLTFLEFFFLSYREEDES